jgi:hypothetical protein
MASTSPAAGDGLPDDVTADSTCVKHGKEEEGEKQSLLHDGSVM